MKAARIALIALACTAPIVASAQWMWLDKDGRKVFSDKAPPPEIAADRIQKAPRGVTLAPVAAAPAADAASAPKAPAKDQALEDRKKQLAAADAEKKKAEDEKIASLKAENCARARQTRGSYQSGQRIARIDAKGERVLVDDNERAAELKRLDEVIARDCAQ